MAHALENGLPDAETCLGIAQKYQMPENVVRHSKIVCIVALYLARKLDEQGLPLDRNLIRAAALLHDITKRFSFNQPLDHALTGAKVLKKMGYKRIGSIVRQHVRVSSSRPPGRISEVEIVNYADKRVVEDRITTLDDRIDYIRRRYGRNPKALENIDKFSAQAYRLEDEIFAVLPGGPAQLLLLNTIKEGEQI